MAPGQKPSEYSGIASTKSHRGSRPHSGSSTTTFSPFLVYSAPDTKPKREAATTGNTKKKRQWYSYREQTNLNLHFTHLSLVSQCQTDNNATSGSAGVPFRPHTITALIVIGPNPLWGAMYAPTVLWHSARLYSHHSSNFVVILIPFLLLCRRRA